MWEKALDILTDTSGEYPRDLDREELEAGDLDSFCAECEADCLDICLCD